MNNKIGAKEQGYLTNTSAVNYSPSDNAAQYSNNFSFLTYNKSMCMRS